MFRVRLCNSHTRMTILAYENEMIYEYLKNSGCSSEQILTLFNKIRLLTVDVPMLKTIKTWVYNIRKSTISEGRTKLIHILKITKFHIIIFTWIA